MSDRIALRGLRVHAFHGVFPSEATSGQEFVIDLELETDLSAALRSDELEDTIDYSTLAADVAARVTGERWNLIESVAGRVAELVLDIDRVTAVAVTIHKPHAPMPFDFDDVSVTIHRSR